MKAKELIEKLKKVPGDTEVFLYDSQFDVYEAFYVCENRLLYRKKGDGDVIRPKNKPQRLSSFVGIVLYSVLDRED